MITTVIISCLIAYVLTSLPLSAMFQKAGEPAWKAWVPLYNSYVYTKLGWDGKIFWVMLLASFILSCVRTAGATNPSVVLAILTVLMTLIVVVLHAMLSIKISTAYGHGGGFAVGVFFVPVIFYFIIGYGSSVYVGKTE